jgi:hypothetical protein
MASTIFSKERVVYSFPILSSARTWERPFRHSRIQVAATLFWASEMTGRLMASNRLRVGERPCGIGWNRSFRTL